MIDIFVGDSSFGLVVVSSMTIGSFDCGWGLPVFIRMLLLALKYMEGSLFCFPFCFGDVLRAASIAAASLAKISGDFSFCCSVSILLVESTMSTVFRFAVETIFMLPIETVLTVSVCLVGCVFHFNFCVVALVVPSFVWTFSVLFALLYNHFSLGVCAIVPPTVLGSAIWPISPFPLCCWIVGVVRVFIYDNIPHNGV